MESVKQKEAGQNSKFIATKHQLFKVRRALRLRDVQILLLTLEDPEPNQGVHSELQPREKAREETELRLESSANSFFLKSRFKRDACYKNCSAGQDIITLLQGQVSFHLLDSPHGDALKVIPPQLFGNNISNPNAQAGIQMGV